MSFTFSGGEWHHHKTPFQATLMAAAGGGAALGTSTGLEAATLQKLALRRKKVLGTEEMELYELALAAGAAIDPEVFKILVDLLNLNVAPLAVFQILKSMCAGQRLTSDPQDSVPVSLSTSETRGRNRGGPTLGSVPTVAERGSREGPIQRMPRQPSATRLPKAGPGKSNSRSST